MFYITRFNRLWAMLPNSQMVMKGSILLHLYPSLAAISEPSNDLSVTFEKDSRVREIINGNSITLYSQEATKFRPELFQRLNIGTVPVIVGLHEGHNIGHFTSSSDASSAAQLCVSLIEAQRLVSDEIQCKEIKNMIKKIKEDISTSSKEGAIRLIEEIRKEYIQQLEYDDALRRFFGEEILQLYLPKGEDGGQSGPEDQLSELKSQLRKIEEIMYKAQKCAADRIINIYSSCSNASLDMETHALKERGNSSSGKYCIEDLDSAIKDMAHELMNEIMEKNRHYEFINNKHHDYLTRIKLIKVSIIQDISVLLFFNRCVDASLSFAVEGYKSLVKLLNEDMISLLEFQRHDMGKIIEHMFCSMAHHHPAVLRARAELEIVDGPRLLNNIPKASRPLGGPVYKRRGFRGKYSWHGPDYRPKKYKPKDPQQYLNEWSYEADSNLPTF